MVFIITISNSCKKDISNSIIIIDNDKDTSIYTASVTIGSQVWMTKNLKTRRYRNGDLIRTTIPATLDITELIAPKYQWVYDGDDWNIDIYGRLYTWYAIMDPRNICPIGWHVPTDDDWTTLLNYLEGKLYTGGNLKEKGTTHWITTSEEATNATGFTALPGGYRFYYGRFSDLGFSGFWWSSSEASDSIAYGRGILTNTSQVPRFSFPKSDGLSVRCIKDN